MSWLARHTRIGAGDLYGWRVGSLLQMGEGIVAVVYIFVSLEKIVACIT